jgi:hypothetical protein
MLAYGKFPPGVSVSVFPLMVVLSGPLYPTTWISPKPGPGCMAVLNVRVTVLFTGTLVAPKYGSIDVTFTGPVVQKVLVYCVEKEFPDASRTASRGIIIQCCWTNHSPVGVIDSVFPLIVVLIAP